MIEIEYENMTPTQAIEVIKVFVPSCVPETDAAFCLGIKALEMQVVLKNYIDECKSCGRGSGVEWLEKFLVN